MRLAVGALACLTLLAVPACSGDSRDLPDAEEFEAGTCRDAAASVLVLDEQAHRALSDDVDAAEVRGLLRTEQDRLRELLAGSASGAAVADELEEVVAAVGFARAALDTGTMAAPVVDDVSAAVDELVAACVQAAG